MCGDRMSKATVINVDKFKQHMAELADRSAGKGDAGSVIAYRMLVEIIDVYADIYGEEIEVK